MVRTELARQLAGTIMKRYPKADAYPYRSWSYPQGYMLIGMSKLWERSGEQKLFDYIREFCEVHTDKDGRVQGFTGCSMDDMMAGAVLVWMYEQTGEERYAAACRRIYESFADYPRTREGGFLHDRTRYPGEMWVDGVFMGQMFYCRYGRAFGEVSCFDEAQHQLELIYRCCHSHDGLLVHAYSEDNLAPWAGRDGKSGYIWSEGLGWYALILSEILDIVPEEHPAWRTAEKQLKALLKGLLPLQDRESGLWYQVVDRPKERDNWCDVSGSAMFTYAFRKALQKKTVQGAEYEEAAARGYEGVKSRAEVNGQGLVDIYGACEGLCVQNSYEAYVHYPQKVNGQEAVCGCLWAAVVSE
jgi:Predicted unsaturated glucuronyl hydrolase involved in regulation of bacterial surface properties, and related proteins